ncbi:MAG: sugar transferase [Nanoarchaeota archaeon]|nr:sugar transferase [Nanoarchaeota archaeon]
MKRCMDIIGGLIGLMVLLIIAPAIAAAILGEDGRPIFIKQKRVSRGKMVNVWKFRSMVKNAEGLRENLRHLNERSDGPFFKIRNDPRVTRVGKFIRKTRLDEFPQFINVVRGELSLVGPRPHEPEEISKYPEKYKKLPLEKAGLTCFSQITGRPFLPFEEEMEFDLLYLKKKSIWTDMRIIANTIKILITTQNGI